MGAHLRRVQPRLLDHSRCQLIRYQLFHEAANEAPRMFTGKPLNQCRKRFVGKVRRDVYLELDRPVFQPLRNLPADAENRGTGYPAMRKEEVSAPLRELLP